MTFQEMGEIIKEIGIIRMIIGISSIYSIWFLFNKVDFEFKLKENTERNRTLFIIFCFQYWLINILKNGQKEESK